MTDRHTYIYNILQRIIDFRWSQLNDYGVDCEIEEIGEMIDAIPDKDKWVSVKDRLPEPDSEKEYLTTCELGGTFTESYFELDGKVGWWSDHFGTEFPVTHWMPLPEPPEVEDE